jgi:hypothetical protein
MPALESDLRRQLENVVIEAREVAEAAARSKLTNLGVAAPEAFNDRDREIRNRLRARGRQAGDVRNSDKTQSLDQLVQELAYEFWHRMLFARFLAENGLLIDPEHEVSVDLDYCEEVAASKGAINGYVLAARYASTMLPQIFRTDDVLLEIDFAPDQRLALEKLLDSLPQQTFLADDSLGWVYQFWQTAEKKRVNDSGDRIDGRTLPAVTQLFTEHYMVEFLLHNTIGAWWCANRGIQGPPGGSGVPSGSSPVEMPYLRWRNDGTPAAGKFDGWPKTLAEFTMLDPCCGSGHFLVAVFNLLVSLRMHDEGLTAEKACEVVLRNNIFGLELDPRCTQIAAFALAMAAWKYPDAGGYRQLPLMNIACSGQSMAGTRDEWLALANGDNRLREGMDALYTLFQQAPHLGSLIAPGKTTGDMYSAGFAALHPLLEKLLGKERARNNADGLSLGVAAQGAARAAELLSRHYSLVATNVPYLGRGKQDENLQEYCDAHHSDAKADLATSFLERCMDACNPNGVIACVTPQNWLFLNDYKSFRRKLLMHTQWLFALRLGAGAFETITGEVVKASLIALRKKTPPKDEVFFATDISALASILEKMAGLKSADFNYLTQEDQLKNPNWVVTSESLTHGKLLQAFATAYEGAKTVDIERFRHFFWELSTVQEQHWWLHNSSPTGEGLVSGCHYVSANRSDGSVFQKNIEVYEQDGRKVVAWMCGSPCWNKMGISVAWMSNLPASLYVGSVFDNSAAVILPKSEEFLPAIYCFITSGEYTREVRKINQKVQVAAGTLDQVPFDLAHWQAVATEKYPNGLPEPHSDDPTQWLFKGDIATSTEPLQVAVARLLGYRWPKQPKATDTIDKLAIKDGILCLPGVRGEPAAAERLLEFLRAAYDDEWTDSVLHHLLTDAGCKAGAKLDDWLRNQFFEQHSKLFHNRPFIWHIWDGRKDGFAALVNYHKLDYKTLENLTHAYLRDWIKEQTHDAKAGKAGADLRLAAGQALQEKLKLILAGEPPCDIFVRWKPLHEQAIGWNPDLNDGVRQNIRPFILAGVFKKEPKSVLKDKDRGNEPKRDKDDYPWYWGGKDFVGDRVNDVNLENADKQAARTRKKGVK